MAVRIHSKWFSIATDQLSAGQWYAQPFGMELPSNEKNNSDHIKWPDNFGT